MYAAIAMLFASLVPVSIVNATENKPISIVDDGLQVENGEPVKPGELEEVVELSVGCSATVVGPNTIITAGHCAKPGRTAWFDFKGVRYAVQLFRSPLTNGSGSGHDMGLGVFTPEIPFGSLQFAVVTDTAKAGTTATITGWGCFTGNGKGSGVLRKGDAQITVMNGEYEFLMVGKVKNCPGDSGSGVFYRVDGYDKLIGVVSKRSIRGQTSYQVRTDTKASKDFFSDMIGVAGAKICGFNYDCIPPAKKETPTQWGAIIY